MLSPNIGLTKGKDALSAALATTNAMKRRKEMQGNLNRMIPLAIAKKNTAVTKIGNGR